MKMRLPWLQKDSDQIVASIHESMKLYSSDDHTSQEFSKILFDKLVGNGISARVIEYNVNQKHFYSVQLLIKGKWINFDYEGLDIFFHPVYAETLNPENVILEEVVM